MTEEFIGDAVRRLREREGLSQEALARRMDRFGYRWHQSTVNKIEKGERRLSLVEGWHLAECLEVRVDEFVVGSPGDLGEKLVYLRRAVDHHETLLEKWRGLRAEVVVNLEQVGDALKELKAELETNPDAEIARENLSLTSLVSRAEQLLAMAETIDG